MIEIPAPETEWDVTYDKDVAEALEELKQSDKWNRVRKTLAEIAENPLKRSAKTGELRGCRATHIQHLVVVWELRSEERGNPITRREYLDSLGEVYVHGICHHDEMTSVVSGRDDPARVERKWGVQFGSCDVMAEISSLYDLGVEVEAERWRGDCVQLLGVSDPDNLDRLEDTIDRGEVYTGPAILST